jgi:hypothetical protein
LLEKIISKDKTENNGSDLNKNNKAESNSTSDFDDLASQLA